MPVTLYARNLMGDYYIELKSKFRDNLLTHEQSRSLLSATAGLYRIRERFNSQWIPFHTFIKKKMAEKLAKHLNAVAMNYGRDHNWVYTIGGNYSQVSNIDLLVANLIDNIGLMNSYKNSNILGMEVVAGIGNCILYKLIKTDIIVYSLIYLDHPLGSSYTQQYVIPYYPSTNGLFNDPSLYRGTRPFALRRWTVLDLEAFSREGADYLTTLIGEIPVMTIERSPFHANGVRVTSPSIFSSSPQPPDVQYSVSLTTSGDGYVTNNF